MSDPDSSVLRLLAQLQPALERDDRPALVTTSAYLAPFRAPMGGQWRALAGVAAGIGELRLFHRALDLLVEGAGADDAARYQKSAMLAEVGEWREAYELLRTLPPDMPDAVSNAYARGAALVNSGRPAEAREHLERAVRLRPELGVPWAVLAMSADLAHEDDLAERIAAAEPGIAKDMPGQYGPYCYALGNVHAARGEHASAFAAYARGAALIRAALGYDGETDRREAE